MISPLLDFCRKARFLSNRGRHATLVTDDEEGGRKMKNEEKEPKKSNVVLFPQLKERLLKRGLDCIEEKAYKEAGDLLHQARSLDADDAEVGKALMITLYQIGDYQEAKEQGRDLLHRGIGDYFEIMDLFLMILVQLGEHEEIVSMINVLLEEKELPPEKKGHYEKLLVFSEKRLPGKDAMPESGSHAKLFDSDDLQEQIFRISKLVHENIQPYLDEIKAYIQDPNQHPFIQTLLINVLKEQQNTDVFEIQKFGRRETISPAELMPIFEAPLYNLLLHQLSKDVEQKNPTLFTHIKTMMDRHFFLL
jgi:tetratricopeptide (TPR) repeat protein